jgi:hypothetical protein
LPDLLQPMKGRLTANRVASRTWFLFIFILTFPVWFVVHDQRGFFREAES